MQMGRTFRTAFFYALVTGLAGCNGLDRLTGTEKKERPHEPRLVTVSCCRDMGVYPASVPIEHQNFCDEIRDRNSRDELYRGDVWLASSVDCGTGHHEIGDEYYQ